MRLSQPWLLLAALVAAVTSVSATAGPSFWTVATAADFLKGTSDGVYVSLSGTVAAGPQLTNRLTSAPAQIWSIAEGQDGTIWAGTGSDGRLIRLRPGQPEETVYDTPENNVFAVALAGNRVYAASSPDGKVYVIEGNEPARTFFDPGEKYIWSLAVDGGGRLWVGAGNPAVIYRVSADGSSQVVYRPPAAHAVTLAPDLNGRMLVGTESPGRLYRIDQQDRPFVLLESGVAELRAISVDTSGTVFAAAVAKGDESSDGGETTSVAVTLAPPPSPTASGAGGASSSTTSASSSTAAPRRSTIYRIDPSGTWEQIWATADLVYDLAAQNDGGVLVATGPEGRLYKVERRLDVLLLTGVDARQVTRFASRTRGAALSSFATANPGRVVSVGTGVQSPARYLSSVQDTKTVATWGLIRWESTGGVTLATRSGNTEKPDDSWSDWSTPYARREGEQVTSPPARFLQWRAVFTDAAAGASARPNTSATSNQSASAASPPERAQLTAVTLAFLPRNNRPTVTSITVHPPGVVFQRPFVNDESAIAGLDPDTAEARRPPGDPGPPSPAPGRRMYQKGLQTISWRAEDSDGDRLDYSLLFRREGDATWRTLRADVSSEIFVWDTTTVGDGRYVVRVQASDKGENVGDRALIGERDSAPVEIDNTPPQIVNEPATGTPPRLVVRVTDARSPILKLEYAVDGGPWQTVYPADGLADSLSERFDITLPAGTDTSRVVLRATDRLQNVVSALAVR
jgi:sugar lactone lactonase YvrE